MENSTFGKTIQSKRKQRNIKLVTNEKKKSVKNIWQFANILNDEKL